MLGNLLNFTKRNLFGLEVDFTADLAFRQKIADFHKRKWPQQLLETSRFVVFDTETTGLCPNKGDEIISIGGVVIENGYLTDQTFSNLVNPFRHIPLITTELTGITNELVATAQDFITVSNNFLDFMGSSMIVAHHAAFDFAFINTKLRRICGQRLRPPFLDTFLISQLLFPNRRTHSLDSLAKTYNVSLNDRHTALGDSIITGRVFLAMVEDLKLIGIRTTSDLLTSLKFRCIY